MRRMFMKPDLKEEIASVVRFETERWRAHLREHDRQRDELDRTAALMNEKLNEMNNLRAQIGQERALYAPREIVDQMEKALNQTITQQVETLRTQTLATQADQNRRLSVIEPRVANNEAGSIKVEETSKRLNVIEMKLSNYEGRMTMLSVIFLILTVLINIGLRFIQ